MNEIEKDLAFFDGSGGGVTFSGGEPLSQTDSLLALLKMCGEKEIHRTVDTSGFAPTDTLMKIADHTDLFLFDVKHMNNEYHKQLTGVANRLILANLQTLSQHGTPIRTRFPLLVRINADEENISGQLAPLLLCVMALKVLIYFPTTHQPPQNTTSWA